MDFVLEALFQLFIAIFRGIFNLLQIIFGANPDFNQKSKYNAKFMKFGTRFRLLNSWNKGVSIGTKKLKIKKSKEHILVIGASGTSKTSSVVIPSILTTKNSFVVTDVDGEIYSKTSGHISKTHDILVLNLANLESSSQYDPMFYCKNDSDLKQLSELLTSTAYSNQQNSENSYWVYGGQSAIYIALRLLMSQPKEFQNLANLRHLLLWFESLETFVSENADESTFSDYLNFVSADSRIVSGFLSSALVSLDKLSDVGISSLTAQNTLDFSKLVKGKKPCALYIIVPESKLLFYSFLLSIFYSQLLSFIQTNKPQKTLFIYLDEFSQLDIKDFPLIATTMRRYNTSITMLVQDLQQIVEKHGINGASAIYNGSSSTKLIFPGMSLDLARKLSQSFGRTGIAIQSQSQTKSYLSDKELLSVQELIQMPKGKGLVVYRNKPPLITKVKPFFKSFSLLHRSRKKPVPFQSNPLTSPKLIPLKLKPKKYEEK
jgi:type IV secretion system protein VirD4